VQRNYHANKTSFPCQLTIGVVPSEVRKPLIYSVIFSTFFLISIILLESLQFFYLFSLYRSLEFKMSKPLFIIEQNLAVPSKFLNSGL